MTPEYAIEGTIFSSVRKEAKKAKIPLKRLRQVDLTVYEHCILFLQAYAECMREMPWGIDPMVLFIIGDEIVPWRLFGIDGIFTSRLFDGEFNLSKDFLAFFWENESFYIDEGVGKFGFHVEVV